jgi:integrase
MTANKLPNAPVFRMPNEFDVAAMVRADLEVARKAWLDAARHDAQELARRQESDFLAAKNHQGESFDFHAFRHTCGAWLIIQGENLKTVQTVMRHSTIKLTMDTYGHMLPDAHAKAVDAMGDLFDPERNSRRNSSSAG